MSKKPAVANLIYARFIGHFRHSSPRRRSLTVPKLSPAVIASPVHVGGPRDPVYVQWARR